MKTEHALAKALKEMMASQSLDSISVLELSKRCGVSRKTFYYHYHDIYDLLTQVFLDEKIPNINSANNYDDLVVIVWKYYQANEKFIAATLSSAGKDLFVEFIFHIFYVSTIRFINKYEESKKITITIKQSIARFYASGYTNSIVYYLTNYKKKTLEGLKHSFIFLDDNKVKKSIQNAVKIIEQVNK